MMGESGFLVFWLLIIVGLYIWMARKRKSEEAARRSFLDSLKKGDRVVTVGGIFGTLDSVSDEMVTLRVAEGVTLKMHKMGINQKQDQE